MANKIIKKSNQRLKFLFRKARFLADHTKKLLGSALVQCHLDYACSFWYSSISISSKNQLQLIQNRLVRFVMNLPFRAHVGPEEYKRIGWLPVGPRVEQIKATHVFRVFNHTSPEYMSHNLNLVSSIHSHETRFSLLSYFIPGVSSHGKSSFFYTGAKIWNSLPNKIKCELCIRKFKTKVKEFLFKEYMTKSTQDFVFY